MPSAEQRSANALEKIEEHVKKLMVRIEPLLVQAEKSLGLHEDPVPELIVPEDHHEEDDG